MGSGDAVVYAALIGASGVALGVIIQLLGSLLVDKRAERREQRVWLRQQKFNTFSALMGATNVVVQTSLLRPGNRSAEFEAMKTVSYAAAPAFVVASHELEEELQEFLDAIGRWLQAPDRSDSADFKRIAVRVRHRISRELGVPEASWKS